MFLSERELKETFWKKYNYSSRAKRYQFEVPIREGNADLVTIEVFQGDVQFNSFEFKLSDIKKVILQAKGNVPYVHKSWIVIPEEKELLIKDRYLNQLNILKNVGVITVNESGKWKMIFKPKFNNEIKINQAIFDMYPESWTHVMN